MATGDRKPCWCCDTDTHPQDATGQCTGCRQPEKMSPSELADLQRQVAATQRSARGAAEMDTTGA